MPRTFAALALVLCIGVLAAGCSRRNQVPDSQGVNHGILEFNGVERSYRLFIPSGLSAEERAPLVIALHGALGSGDQFAGTSNFETLAESEGFIVVYPDGLDATWNAGACCGESARNDTDDVGFLSALVQELILALPIDTERVFMTGQSNGAMMAFRFGCERADLVKAVAPAAGSLEVPVCEPANGVSLLAIHGSADRIHPIGGGRGPESPDEVQFVSMDDSLAIWTDAMGCAALPDRSVAGALTTTVWTDCRDGSRATYIVIAGAGHSWPGGNWIAPAGAGQPSGALDATLAVWTFFKTLP